MLQNKMLVFLLQRHDCKLFHFIVSRRIIILCGRRVKYISIVSVVPEKFPEDSDRFVSSVSPV